MLQRSGRAVGFIEPCLPSPAKAPPSGADWLHENKYDGFRIMALRDTKVRAALTSATATILPSASPWSWRL
jgi:ATP-dependent DNA ligase